MMQDWFKPPRKVKPGWQWRIAFMVVGTWFVAYLGIGREMFRLSGAIAMGIVVIQCVIFYALLHLLDPILRARLRTRSAKRS